MLKVNVKYEKNAVSTKNKEGVILLELGMTNNKKVKSVKRKNLNLSLVVDVSYSMSEPLERGYKGHIYNRGFIQNNLLNNHLNGNMLFAEPTYNPQVRVTKLEQAKKMATHIINELQNGDIFSLITFSENAEVLQEAVVINEVNKQLLLNKVNGMSVQGNTNLYAGWEKGATESAKFVSGKTLNRIIMLTDGAVNKGLQNFDDIARRVGAMTKANIQTTTIGIGEGFQEKLLSEMAEKGEGNFFFVEKDEDFVSMLNIELKGLENSSLTNVELKFNSKNKVIFEQLNGYKEENDIVKVPNLRAIKNTILVINFKIDEELKKSKKKNFNLGDLEITGVDIEGNKIKYSEELNVSILSDEDFDKLAADGEVTIQKVLMNIANEQQKASDLILQGKSVEARTMMTQSLDLLKAEYSDNAMANAMAVNIEGSLLKDDNAMSKVFRASSYSSRYGLSGDDEEKV